MDGFSSHYQLRDPVVIDTLIFIACVSVWLYVCKSEVENKGRNREDTTQESESDPRILKVSDSVSAWYWWW